MKNLNDVDRKQLTRSHGRVVRTINAYELGVCADIFLNKNNMVFSAHLNGEVKLSKDGEVVAKWVCQQMEVAVSMTWVPVICVLDTEHGDFNYGGRHLELHQIGFDIHRFYVAALQDGRIRAVEWDVPESARMTSQDVPHTWVSNIKGKDIVAEDGSIKLPLHGGATHVLPYSEPLWHGLTELMRAIDQLRNQVHALLRSEDGLLRLQDVGARMTKLLGPGELLLAQLKEYKDEV